MLDLKDIKELTKDISLSNLYEIAKNAAQIGNEILKNNYNKIQTILSKGRKGDLVTNVDLEVEYKIKEYLLKETPNISINAEETGILNKSSDGAYKVAIGCPFSTVPPNSISNFIPTEWSILSSTLLRPPPSEIRMFPKALVSM